MLTNAPVDHLDVAVFRARILSDRLGFLTDRELARLAAHSEGRLTQVLVRAGCCRFTCAAQDVAHLERCLTAGGDYIRDVSFPAKGGA